MVDPVGGDDEEVSTQEMVANEVNKRMGRAVEELKEKYDLGGRGYDAPSDAQPTGAAYARARQEQAQARQLAREKKQAVEAGRREEEEELAAQLAASARLSGEDGGDDVDSDDELLEGLDNDPELRLIRDRRLNEMRKAYDARAENIGKGHGQVRQL
ncbi:unnamed protein product, partial [Choristocarpus tenellus]